MLLRLRHLEQVLGLWPVGPGSLPLAAEHCLRAARLAAAHGWGASDAWAVRLRSLVSREAAAGLVELARSEYAAAAARERADRAAAWHCFVDKDFRVGGRRVYRWIREPASVAPSPLVSLDGVLAGGPAAELQAATTAWQPLWQRADAPPEEEAEWLGHLSGLPRFPALEVLTPQRVQEGINHLANGRASGLDDWVGEELRLWPAQLVVALTTLLVQVETLGRWPSGLQGAEVVLPPKPGGDPGDPLNRRPLNVLSVVYRVWARLRHREVATWRKGWDPAVGAARLGASGQAWELAWAHAVARAKGDEFGGLAVDFRKAYDSVRLGLVRRALLAAGWPAALWGPVVAAYEAPRRLRVAGAMGQPWLPTSGIPAGCPLAVDVLAVISIVWAVALAAAPLPPVARRFVDDLTCWKAGDVPAVAAAVSAAWESTMGFASALQLDIHPDKTVQFGASVLVREALVDEDPGLEVKRSFRDLGVQQVLGLAGAAAAGDGRVAGSWDRFRRLAALPLPYQVRVHAAAAAGVAAATWGACVGPPTARVLGRLRTAAGRAVWRGGRFGAVELRLLLGAPLGRADPAAACALEPLLMLAKALRWGLTSEAEVVEVQEHASSTPVGRGLSLSLKRLGLAGSWTCWSPRDAAEGVGGLRPAATPLAVTRLWLQDRWRRTCMKAVAGRRPPFIGAATDIDWAVARKQLADPWLSCGLQAALRSIMVGDAVPQVRASHWREGDRRCPRCGAAEETVEHLLWACPAWEAARSAAAASVGASVVDLRAAAGSLGGHCGLLPAAGAHVDLWLATEAGPLARRAARGRVDRWGRRPPRGAWAGCGHLGHVVGGG